MSTDPSAPGAPGATSAGGPSAGSGPGGPSAPGPAGPGPGGQPSEEELRAAYEAELARITSTDMMLQSAVSLLNVASYRLMPRPPAGAAGASGAEQPGAGQDLEQVRDAIDGVRALLEILERRVPSELRPLRDALSQLQMAYAREAQAVGQAVGGEPAASGAPGAGSAGAAAEPARSSDAPPPSASPGAGAPGPADSSQGQGDPAQAPDEQGKRGPGPAESSGRLWVPGR